MEKKKITKKKNEIKNIYNNNDYIFNLSMYQELSNRYFKTILTEEHNEYTFKIIRPIGHPIVLFSKIDGSPLASIHLKCKNNEKKALFTRRPNKSKVNCDFQGIIDTDEQEFEFVITNLSTDGYINFNILKQDKKVNEVNPNGLNEINELRPYESYVVQCDQINNKSLILSSIKKNNGNNIEKITISEAESSDENIPIGTYYFLSVIPQLDKTELVEKYKNTFWSCVDLFYLKEKIKQKKITHDIDMSFGLDRGISFAETFAGDNLLRNRFMDNRTYIQSPKNIDYNPVLSRNIFTRSSNLRRNIFTDTNVLDNLVKKSNINYIDDDDNSLSISDDIINDSYASNVIAGRDVVVNSIETGILYSYDTPAESCVICLSVSDKLKINSEPDDKEFMEQAKTLLLDLIKNQGKELLSKLTKIFESDECVICLEGKKDNKVLDIIFYQCGHQCCHAECFTNINKCPLCRNLISATIHI